MKMKKPKGIKKYLGLMFRTKNTAPLEFEFEEEVMIPINSFFVFFPFYACWYSEKGELIEKRLIKPFRLNIKPKRPFKILVEAPINGK